MSSFTEEYQLDMEDEDEDGEVELVVQVRLQVQGSLKSSKNVCFVCLPFVINVSFSIEESVKTD